MTDESTGPKPVGSYLPAMPPSPDSQSHSSSSQSAKEAKRRAIAEKVGTLLNHYWTPADDPRVRARTAADWIADLIEFDFDVVAEACDEWRRGQERRPTPAGLRAICWRTVREREQRHLDQTKFALPQLTHQQRLEAAREAAAQETRYAQAFAWRQRFAESRGFPDYTAVMAHGILRAEKLPCREGYPDPLRESLKP